MEEETVKGAVKVEVEVKDDIENQSEEMLSNKADKVDNRSKIFKMNAIRMAGFFCWSNFAAFISLMIGCFAPGWLIVGSKEYSLWYVTVCDKVYPDNSFSFISHDRLRQCETIPYRLIQRWRIHTDLDNTDFVQAEVLYCIGMILSFATLIKFYGYRKKVARGIYVELSLTKWILLFISASISGVVVLHPVGMFNRATHMTTDVSLFSGIVFAGFGGAVMTLIAFLILLHLLCRPTSYGICICGAIREPVLKA